MKFFLKIFFFFFLKKKKKMNQYEKILGPNLNPILKYEHNSKSNTLCLHLTSNKTNSIKIPSTINENLKISNKFLIIQLFHNLSENFSIILNIKNINDQILKIVFSSTIRNSTKSLFNSIQCHIEIDNNTWVNICFDLEGIITKFFPGNIYQELQNIEITPTCSIRWIFTSTNPLKTINFGKDLPNFAIYNGINSKTYNIIEKPKISKIPIRKKTPINNIRPKLIENKNIISSEEDEEPSEDPFVQSNHKIENNEEEELELFFIDSLGCFYCPSNQKYYEIEDE